MNMPYNTYSGRKFELTLYMLRQKKNSEDVFYFRIKVLFKVTKILLTFKKIIA